MFFLAWNPKESVVLDWLVTLNIKTQHIAKREPGKLHESLDFHFCSLHWGLEYISAVSKNKI